MIKIKIISFLLIIGVVIFLVMPKTIAVICHNSIKTKVLNIELFVDGKKIENKEVVYSYLFPIETTYLKVGLGYHIIKVRCAELKIEKSVKVFTLFKNNVEFEFVENTDSSFIVIERNSWFPLVYE